MTVRIDAAPNERGSAPATGPFSRDRATTALILGFAGFMWFGWAQQEPPAGWSVPLLIGSIVGMGVALVAGVLAWQRRRGDSAMNDSLVRRGYRRIVALEVTAILIGVGALGGVSRPAYIPAWILLVVGVHFVPMAHLFKTPGLTIAGGLLIVVAAAAATIGAVGAALPSAVAGAGGGLVCVGFSAAYLGGAYRRSATGD